MSNHREELSLAFSEDDGKSWTQPVVIAKIPGKQVSYPFVFEKDPEQIWLTSMFGELRVEMRESDFVR